MAYNANHVFRKIILTGQILNHIPELLFCGFFCLIDLAKEPSDTVARTFKNQILRLHLLVFFEKKHQIVKIKTGRVPMIFTVTRTVERRLQRFIKLEMRQQNLRSGFSWQQ